MLARLRTPAALLSLLCGALILLACGRSGPEPTAARSDAPEERAAVAIQLFQYRPSPYEVATGTTITWTNRDDILHTVTSGAPGAADGRFDGTLDAKDTTFRFTFSQPGTYPYFCSRHESMRGEVRVV